MTRIVFQAVLLVGCMLPAMAQADDQDVPGAYSHALPLTVSGRQAVVQLRLPQAVYLNAKTANLDDLRVFDALGRRVAYAIRHAPARTAIERRPVEARIFPIAGDGVESGNGLAGLEVRTSADGALLSVTARTKPAAATAQLSSLILDMRDHGQAVTINALKLTLPGGLKNYRARLILDVSDDLKHWDTVAQSEVSWLVNGNADALSSEGIEFATQAVRYARLSWASGTPIQFPRISAEAMVFATTEPPIEKLLLAPAPGRLPNDLVYNAGVAIPVQKVGLQLSEKSAVLPVQLGSYVELPAVNGKTEGTWRFRPVVQSTFYRIEQDGVVRSSGDLALPDTHVAQWVLRSETPMDSKPLLRLSWQPSTLVFLATGSPPYTLVFGRAGARNAQLDLSSISPGFSDTELLKVEQVQVGELRSQQASATAAISEGEQAGKDARLRTIGLWAALLAGVGVLGVMVWKLARQMNTGD